MAYGAPVTMEELTRDASAKRGFTPATALFLAALDHRLNSQTVLADVPTFAWGMDPATTLFAWLDAGAPGLSEAAARCDWAGIRLTFAPGPSPEIAACSYSALGELLHAMVHAWPSPYAVALPDPDALVAGFVASELASTSERSFLVVSTSSLRARTRYFYGLGADAFLVWCSPHGMRALFTNGWD